MNRDERKIQKQLEKEKKKIEKLEKKAAALSNANDKRTELAGKGQDARATLRTEETYSKHLDRVQLRDQVREVRNNLYIQRDRLLSRLMTFVKDYRYLSEKPKSPVQQEGLYKAETGAKNTAFAIALVDDAINRLNSIPNEYEWRETIRDLTRGYKLVNQISIGSDLMTRLAFLLQKARYDIKGDLSVSAMEHYYGRSIDKLLEEQTGTENAGELFVNREIMNIETQDQALEAIQWGNVFTVMPREAVKVAGEQSEKAERERRRPVIENPDEEFSQPGDMSTALGIDAIPGISR